MSTFPEILIAGTVAIPFIACIIPVNNNIPLRCRSLPEGITNINTPFGSWERVETAANDSDIYNRSFTSTDGAVINDTVARWKPTQVDKKMTAQQQQLKSMKDYQWATYKTIIALC